MGGRNVGTAGGDLLRGGRFLQGVFAAMGSLFDRERHRAARATARSLRQRNHHHFADAAWLRVQISQEFL